MMDKAQRTAYDRAYNQQRSKAARKRLAEIKIARGCIDCGYRAHPAALHFDHREPHLKLFTISQVAHRSWAVIEAEIAKCDVRCANCHAVRTAGQQGAHKDWQPPPPEQDIYHLWVKKGFADLPTVGSRSSKS